MQHLQNYVPAVGSEGDLIDVLANGDNLSVERMRMAKRGAVNGMSSKGRLEGLQECPQEFHKEALLLQDYMNKYFTQKSILSKGTLYYLKVRFGHHTLKKKVMDNFRHSWEMCEFTTMGYVLLLAMRLKDMDKLDSVPTDYPASGSRAEKTAWVERLAKEVVGTFWNPTSSEDIKQAADAFIKFKAEEDQGPAEETFPFCSCNTDKDDAMVLCCNALCIQQWFHLSCLGEHQNPQEHKDWYCSNECRASKGYIYCYCKTKKPGKAMIQCALNSNCRRQEWYHRDCLNNKLPMPDKWFCCEECSLGAGEDDSVFNHSKALLWDGLNLLARRDAVREGDGPAIISHWRMDMVSFWGHNHYKYLLSACQLLAGASGTIGERLKEDLIWNRVANLKGGPGRNIGLDLVNEFINNDFKEMLKHCHGRYTENQITRVVEMSGAFGRKLDAMFTEAQLGKLETDRYHGKAAWFEADIKSMVEELQPEALLDYCPVREHRGFPQFIQNVRIRSPLKMGARIAKCADDMDFWAELAGDLRQRQPAAIDE